MGAAEAAEAERRARAASAAERGARRERGVLRDMRDPCEEGFRYRNTIAKCGRNRKGQGREARQEEKEKPARKVVGAAGVEPALLAEQEPKSCVYANFTTRPNGAIL